MVKRRRSCDTDTDSFARAKKSKNPLPYDPAEICNELYETIRSYKTDDGRILCDSFVRNKRNREFLEAMRNHIDFTTISQKVKAGSYTNLDQMTNDFEQMINDAKEFFTPDSQDHQDADELWELFNGAKEELIESAMGEGDDDVADDDRLDEDDEEDDDVEEDDDDDDEAEGGGDDEEKVEDQNPFEELFAAVMLAKDPNDRKGRSISEPFQLLPSNSKYPEYYKIITEPIDLRIIAQKIQSNGYKSLNELEADLLLMVKNAKTFNEPGSLIYRDATSLKRIITAKKLQLDSERSKPVKVSKRIQSKRPTTGKRLSAVTAALKYAPDDAEEDDEEDEHESEIEDADMEEEEDEDSAMWMLYNTILNAEDDGVSLSEPFMRLPNRKTYPDYYLEIAKPICMIQIRKKIQRAQYESLNDLADDFTILFTNAMHYNQDESKIHQDARDLLKLMNSKKRDLEKNMPLEGGSTKKQKKEDLFQKRLRLIYDTVLEARDSEDRERDIVGIFMKLPSKKEYPDYYQIIPEPIDMSMINAKIRSSAYITEKELIKDFELMFNNARHYNEENSEIYNDAVLLERILKEKIKTLPPLPYDPAKLNKVSIARSAIEKVQRNPRSNCKGSFEVCLEELLTDSDSPVVESRKTREAEHKSRFMGTIGLCSSDIGLNGSGIGLPNSDKVLHSGEAFTCGAGDLVEPAPTLGMAAAESKDRFSIKRKAKNRVVENPLLCSTVGTTELLVERRCEPETAVLGLKDVIASSLVSARPQPLRQSCLSTTKKRVDEKAKDDEPLTRHFTDNISPVKAPSSASAGTGTGSSVTVAYGSEDEELNNDDVNEEVTLRPVVTLTTETEKGRDDAEPLRIKVIKLRRDIEEMRSKFQTKEKKSRRKSNEGKGRGKFVHNPPPLHQKMRDIYEAIRDYSDTHGRVLSGPFMKLPLKTEYPDYYDVIKRPIDMARILQKINASQISVGEGPAADASLQGIKYTNIEEFTADFVLLFDNACKYNEPDSLIYKDALTLQRVLLEKKGEFFEEDSEVPNVAALVQELMLSIFINTYNHKDEEGRCFSDSLGEVPKFDPVGETSSSPTTPLTLDTIKRNLDRGRYHRFDRFQSHMFSVFERARRLSRTDSQVYEDAVEMQMFFIRERDERLKNTLMTSAVNYTDKYLQFQVEAEKRDRRPKEIRDEIEDENKGLPKQDGETLVESLVHNGMMVNVGDFLYADPREAKLEPHIVHVERIWKDASGDTYLWANFFYRPGETYHVATRKFLEKEVFKSDYYEKLPLAKVLGKCFVMFVKDYYRSCPEGFEDKDVWVCESKYVAKNKAFKKMKIWNVKSASDYRIVSRISPKVPVRIPSEFAKAGGTSPMPSAFSDMDVSVIDKERENIPLEVGDEGNQYYEQYNFPVGCFKLGDCAYVKSDTDRPYIARIDRIWEDQAGEAWFTGPWFVFPNEVEHPPTRLFYKREVFLSSVEDVNSIRSVLGKCSVLSYKDYISCRVTEIPEKSTYVVESKYLELEKQIRKIPKGLKSYTLSPRVTDDEIFFFRKQILPQKEPSPMLLKKTDDEEEGLLDANDFIHGLSEDSNMSESMITPAKTLSTPGGLIIASGGSGSPLHPGMPGGGIVLNPSVGIAHNVMMGKGGIKTAKKTMVGSLNKSKSGYIVFASEIRRNIQRANPDASFGDISRIVGEEWRTLPATKKEEYEEKARKMAEEHSRSITVTGLDMPMSPGGVVSGFPIYPGAASPRPVLAGSPAATPTSSLAKSPGPNELVCVYDCLWENCGYQFEELGDLIDHINQTSDAGSHCQATNGEFLCLWQGCNRTKKDPKPFPTAHRLVRHLKEVHLKASAARRIKQCHKGPNFYPSSRRFYSQGQHSNDGMGPPVGMMSPSHNSNSMDGFSTGYRTVAIPQNSVVSMPQQPQHVVMSSASAPQAGATMATHQQPMGVPLDPLFVAPPPKTHKALHSEIYLRYIENLAAKRSTMTDFHSTLSARKTNATPAPGRALPTHWFKDGQPPAHQGNAVDALWALRNYMLKDALSIRAGAISDYAGPL